MLKHYRVWWEWEKGIVVGEQLKVYTKNLEKIWFLNNERQGSNDTYIFVNILQFMKPNVPANENLSRISLMGSD